MANTKPQVFNRYSISDTFSQPWFNNLKKSLEFRWRENISYTYLIDQKIVIIFFSKNHFLLYTILAYNYSIKYISFKKKRIIEKSDSLLNRPSDVYFDAKIQLQPKVLGWKLSTIHLKTSLEMSAVSAGDLSVIPNERFQFL